MINILKIVAASSDRKEVSVFDLLLLKYMIWKNENDISKIKEIINNTILDIEELKTNEFEIILEKWENHFNNFFRLQKKDNQGNLLYYDINNEITKESKGLLHLKDSQGNYIYFKGYREYIKVAYELGKFDHGYIDTGIRTLDKKIIWKYEYSPTEVITNKEKEYSGFSKLTVEGSLNEAKFLDFSDYYQTNKNSINEFKPIFKDILFNIKFEFDNLKIIYNNLLEKKEFLSNQEKNIIWISTIELNEINLLISNRVNDTIKLMNSYEKFIDNLERSIYE